MDFKDIKVIHGGGTIQTDYNGILIKAFEGELSILKVSDFVSDISEEPAVAYVTADSAVNVTPLELVRLVLRNLKPQECLTLREVHNNLYEVHDDFYDEDGIALQPKEVG